MPLKTILFRTVALWLYLIGMNSNRNLCRLDGLSTSRRSTIFRSWRPRSVLKSIVVPVWPRPSLAAKIVADGNQKPAAPSMWYSSPVGGSLVGRGRNWAWTGAAAQTNASATEQEAYARIADLCCFMEGRIPGKRCDQHLLPAFARSARRRGAPSLGCVRP